MVSVFPQGLTKYVVYICAQHFTCSNSNSDSQLHLSSQGPGWARRPRYVSFQTRRCGKHRDRDASKIIAERKGWEFYEQAKAGGAECHWDLAVVIPPWVFGPVIHEVKGGAETLNNSNAFWYNAVVKGTCPYPASYS